jgi:hypothetical protein
MDREGVFKCPQCGKLLRAVYPMPYVDCDCYQICDDGTGNHYPTSGCSWTAWNYTGDAGSKEHIDTNPADLKKDLFHIVGYCSAHDRYTHKTQTVIDIDWEDFFENPPSYANRNRKR